METEKHIEIFGDPVDLKALEQIRNCLLDERATAGALMADHHLGYSMPIGGVVAYKDAVSPSGVGFDIGCGNKAVRTNIKLMDLLPQWAAAPYPDAVRKAIRPVMEAIKGTVSFGVGRKNQEKVDHSLFDDPFWTEITKLSPHLKEKARDQLGTVGGGNHYVDLLVDNEGYIWVANHFGSRGFGHTIASGFMNLDRTPDYVLTDRVGIRRAFGARLKESEDPCVLSTDTDLGQSYLEAMRLAGEYAYAGRDFVIDKVLAILGAEYDWHVHNHHNFAWLENGEWVVRKGATPLTAGMAFIGGSMGDKSVIVQGRGIEVPFSVEGIRGDLSHYVSDIIDIGALGSAPHGAGRVMSRTAAAGKKRKMWYCNNQNCKFEPVRSEYGVSESPYPGGKCPLCKLPLRKGPMRDTSTAAIDWRSVSSDLYDRGITVLGANAEEAPGVYKDLTSVLAHHSNIEVVWELQPIGVVMADADEIDPWKD